jgi:putative membrane protein
MMSWHNGGSGGQWAAMTVMMIVGLGLLVAFFLWIARSSRDESQPISTTEPTPPDSADRLLAERFARGEIDEDEFTRSRTVLHPTSRSS